MVVKRPALCRLHIAGRNAINRERKGIAWCKNTHKKGYFEKNT